MYKILLTISIAALSCMSTAYAMEPVINQDAGKVDINGEGFKAFRAQYLSSAIEPADRETYNYLFNVADSYQVSSQTALNAERKKKHEAMRDDFLADIYSLMQLRAASHLQNPNLAAANAEEIKEQDNEPENNDQELGSDSDSDQDIPDNDDHKMHDDGILQNKNFERAKVTLKSNLASLAEIRRGFSVKDFAMNPDLQKQHPAEISKLMEVLTKFKNTTQPDDRLRCEMDQRAISIVTINVQAETDKDLELRVGMSAEDLTPHQLDELKKMRNDWIAQLQKEVDDHAAKLGLPRLFNTDAGIWSKTKTFMSNHKLMLVCATTAIVGAVWYMRHKADELDLKGRVKACKDYIQTKLGLKKNFKHA